MLKGFKDFITRGNVIDLAVAVVIGSAFAAVVATVVSAVIEPVLAALGGVDAPGWGFYLREDNPATFVDIGAIVSAVIVFLVTAAVVYVILVLPMNKLAELRAKGAEPEPEAPAEDVVVLREIRDLLARRDHA
jgi:large conductance mechanosensitive channel